MHGSAPRLCPDSKLSVRRLVLIALLVGLSACVRNSPAGPSGSAIAGNLSFCADEVNRYRATAGRPPLVRSADLEAFAAAAAQNDGLMHLAHHFFATTNGGGTAAAENEILWWRGFGVRGVIEQGLEQMWKAGPDGEHYDIMVGNFSQIGCGIFVNGSEVTVAQDFR
jgi:cysteine-rich secretory family protein